MLSKDDLAALMTAAPSRAVSLFLPTHVAGREIRQDPIRLKNQLDEAERLLIELGLRPPECQAILAPAFELVDDHEFWRHQSGGLALFLAPKFFQCHKVPIELPDRVVVAERFHVKPLLPAFAADGRFFVLTLAAGEVRLFEASRFDMTERQDARLPESAAGLYAETDYQNTAHASPVARPYAGRPTQVPKSHSFGDTAEDLRKDQLVAFVRRVSTALEEHLGDVQAPLVLAAEPEIGGQFRKHYKPKNLLPEGIETDPQSMDVPSLHRRAYELVRPFFLRGREQTIDRFRTLQGNGDPRAAQRIEEIVPAARFGRVDTLLLAAEATRWGRFDEVANAVTVHDEEAPGDQDLLDYAAVQTLLQGGRVELMDETTLPVGGPVAAILRY